MRVYVASSWRNQRVTEVIAALRRSVDVYDFREDDDVGSAFNWSDIDPEWQKWTADEFMENLWDPVANAGFNRDMEALNTADALVLVMPCGRSAHLELGYAIGQGKPTAVLLDGSEPELMYRAVTVLAGNLRQLVYRFHSDILDPWRCRSERFTMEPRPRTQKPHS